MERRPTELSMTIRREAGLVDGHIRVTLEPSKRTVRSLRLELGAQLILLAG